MKNCIICSISPENICDSWIDEISKANFDIYLILYKDKSLYDLNRLSKFKNISYDESFKFPAIYNFMNKNPHILEQYDYFWLPDDDIKLNTQGINDLFDMAKKYNMNVLQPSQDNKSYRSQFQLLWQKPYCKSILRYTTYVEIMCPMFSKDALKKSLEIFPKSKSGWGIDYAYCKVLNYEKIGVTDQISITHIKPIGQSNLYKNTNPTEEVMRLINEYNAPPIVEPRGEENV